ncbi:MULTISPECIES: protein translocase subunit SecD [Metallibacterium]|jgi:preprotein translocase subunit SecD|uniref:protein translocase subunit SecD n=1 Tax=Metallibacterium TaxID=1218803 RepID=UPI00261A40AE|nr:MULTISPECIES: protein translocase subunit SecD [Metallibacterium]MBW8075983.1 protein translocase subunit SecD [Metallibacterium scheffleri]
MTDFPRWKYWLVLVVLLFGILYALPNAFRPQAAVQIQGSSSNPVTPALQQQVAQVLRKAGIPGVNSNMQGERLLVRFSNTDTQLKAYTALRDALGDKYVVAVNLASSVPHWLRAIGANAMPLGLDLQGGVHFLMQVDSGSVLDQQMQRYMDDVRDSLRAKKIEYDSVTRSGSSIRVVFKTAAARDAGRALIARNDSALQLTDGSSGDGGYALRATLSPAELNKIETSIIHQNLTTLRNRVNALGVSEPVIQQQGATRIVVELPGVQDTTEAKKILGATATIEYHAVDQNADIPQILKTGIVPPEDKLYYTRQGQPIVLKKKIIASGDEMINASSGFDQQSGQPTVNVELDSAAAARMFDFTSKNVGKPMAVLYIERIPEVKTVDGKEVHTSKTKEEVINHAVIQGVFSKNFQTTGLTQGEAKDLATLLKSGSLAAPMNIVEERVIGPSLGQQNIEKGLLSVLLGLSLVLVAAAIYYKLFGLVADIALVFNLVLLVAVLSLFQATLTMPGIAGIVLTLGMAIDANVLICERVREELRNGSTPLAAIRAGYEKAWATILDANVTHLLAAFGLMTFGSGSIRGFAVTLAVGILTSMFTSVTATHAITALIHGGRKLKTLSV